jgi:hypothetical protein
MVASPLVDASRAAARMSPRVTPGSPLTPTIRDVKSYFYLKALSDGELERRLDATLQSGTALHTQFYREEIARRESERSSKKMVELTVQIRALTVTVTAATIVALAISVVALLQR